MSDTLRGLVLPGFLWPEPDDLLSALLVWEELEIEEWSGAAPLGEESSVYPELLEAGLIRPFPPYIEVEPVVDPSIPADETEAEGLARAEDNGIRLADGMIDVVGRGLREARERDLAPLALTELTELALALPPPDPDAPLALANVIRVATAGVRIDRRTGVEDLIGFRERNRALMGRLRAVLGDLAASLETDDPRRAAERAQATLTNRLEPMLGEMTDALSRARIGFAIETLLGATAVSLAPLDPATLVVAGGALAVRALKYSFDRERIVREHPLGLIYRARGRLDQPPAGRATGVDDPRSVIRAVCVSGWLALHRELNERR